MDLDLMILELHGKLISIQEKVFQLEALVVKNNLEDEVLDKDVIKSLKLLKIKCSDLDRSSIEGNAEVFIFLLDQWEKEVELVEASLLDAKVIKSPLWS